MATETRDKLLEAAQGLMLERGYAATGINDICQAAGVSKGAFYHLFESKEALALAALDTFYDAGVAAMASVDLSDVAPEERGPVFIERVAEMAPYLWEEGCLIGGLANESALASDTLQQRVSRQFGQFAGLVKGVMEPFANSLAVPELDAEALAEEFLTTVEGAIVLSRAHRDPEIIRTSLKRFSVYLRHLPRA